MVSDTDYRVAVLGLGYIGLPTAAVIARTGAQVLGVDVTPSVVETVNSGKVHIEEVDLDGLVSGVVARGDLRASLQIEPSDVFVIAVPTPFDEDHQPNIGYVLRAATTVATVLKAGDLVVLESTSPVGTTEKVADLLAELRPDLRIPGRTAETPDVAIAYCPERVLPGRILIELIDNDRVIGGVTSRCARKALSFYRRFVRGACVTTTARAAEMTKLTENAFRDVNIAFANELSVVADGMGVDVWEVIRLANRHPRVNILAPGPGVGGHCIAVDPWFLVSADPVNTPLIRTARLVNDAKIDHTIVKAGDMIAATSGPVALLGLAFKANIDDFRESPALKVATALAVRFGERVRIVEPHTRILPPALARTEATLIDIDSALETCPTMVVLVDHDVFKAIPLDERGGKTVYDTRGIWPDQPRRGRHRPASPPPRRDLIGAVVAGRAPVFPADAAPPMLKSLFRKSVADRQPPRVPDDVRVYAIGDIHGRADLFDDILTRIVTDDAARAPKRMILILLGDLIDRGPESAGVVERAIALDATSDETHVIAGNHEELMLQAIEGDREALRLFSRVGGRETILSYGVPEAAYDRADFDELAELIASHVPQTHVDFLACMEDVVEIGDYAFVHAGIRPGVPLAEQQRSHLRWIRAEFLDYREPHPRFIVHGHTITETIDERPNRLGIDTGAYSSGRLTAVGLQGAERWFMQTG